MSAEGFFIAILTLMLIFYHRNPQLGLNAVNMYKLLNFNIFLMVVVMLSLNGCGSGAAHHQYHHLQDNLYNPPTNLYTPTHYALTPVGANVPTGPEREALNRFLHELQVLEVLLHDARAHQNPQQRIKFHYPLVHDDLSKIRDGITAYLHARDSRPRDVEPVSGDYRY